jgi:hypothetical protein
MKMTASRQNHTDSRHLRHEGYLASMRLLFHYQQRQPQLKWTPQRIEGIGAGSLFLYLSPKTTWSNPFDQFAPKAEAGGQKRHRKNEVAEM